MKKGFLFSIITAIFSLFISVGLSNWIINSQVEVKQNATLTSPGGIIECYKVNNDKEESAPYAKFCTLEGAIASANDTVKTSSKVNMYLKTGSFIDVRNKNLTLNSGVSLFLPYEAKTYDIFSENEIKNLSDGFIDTDDSSIKTYNVSKLTFTNSRLTISSGAQVYIGGKFREKGVSGYYTEIDLDPFSNILVNGSLYCHGYIKEVQASNVEQNDRFGLNLFFNTFDKKRYVEVKDGGYFSSPLAFYDAGGMGELVGLNSKGVFPINVFDLPCIQTYLKIDFGAIFKAPARMMRATAGKSFPVMETLTIIKPQGSNLSSLMTLKNGYISFEYCPMTPGYTKSDRSKTYVVINGGTDLGFLEIKVNGQSITTADKFLPFSYKFQLVVGENGKFNTGRYKIKFMGGSLIKILSGGLLTNQSEIIGYKANSAQGILDYPTDVEDSKIIVNGSLVLDSSAKLGGHISTEAKNDSAKIDFSKVSQTQLCVSSSEGLSQTTIRIYATGDFFDDEKANISTNLFKASITISSDYQGRMCWADGCNLISYILTIAVDNTNNYEHPLIGYKVYKYDSQGNKTLLSTDGIYMTSGGDYTFEKGEYFEIESLERAEKTEFTKQADSDYTFSNGTKYLIKGDTTITTVPGEGMLVKFSIDGESGSGGSTVKISESLTKGGTYYQIGQSSSGTAVEIPVKKNAYVKYEVIQGPCRKKLEEHYLFKGIVNIKTGDDTTKNSGTKLATKFKNNLGFSLFGGAESISTDTLITEPSTIHAYIKN